MASSADNATGALDLPAIPPPAGLVSNFNHPVNRGNIIIVVGSILISLTMIFVAVRIYTKARIQKKLWWDDLTCGLAAATAIVHFFGCVWSAKSGFGIHMWNIKAKSIGHDFYLSSYLSTVLIAPALGFTKITFFLLYYQLFRPKMILRYLIYIGGAATAVFYAGATVAQFVFATPEPGETFATHWYSPLQHKILKFSVAHSAVGGVIDLYILVLPIAAVLQLKLATKRKIGIVLIFMTGALAVIASFLSAYYRYRLNKTDDVSWAVVPVIILSLIEICIGIMCSCMPSLARELRQHASPFAMLQSFFSLPFKYFSNRHSRSVPTAESGSPPRYQLKTKKKYLELEVGMSQFGGSDETSSEGSQQCNLESLGTKHFKTFDGEEDRIHLRQEVTVSRQ